MKRSNYFDIVKGLGILSVVIGHCANPVITRFVYSYHLVIFFFIGGYFYNKEKYENDPYLNFSSRVKNNWNRYFLYSLFYVVFHNLFVRLGILTPNLSYYTFDTFMPALMQAMIFLCYEPFSGPLWFVPVMIFAMTIFGILVYFSNKLKTKKKDYSALGLLGSVLVVGFIGVLTNSHNIGIIYHLQTSLAVVPIIYLGYLTRKYLTEEKIKKVTPWYGLIISLLLLLGLLKLFPTYQVELSANMLFKLSLFYPLSAVGIYFCLALATLLSKLNNISNIFSLMGRFSFDIMALHVFFFKIIDIILIRILGVTNSPLYLFPISDVNFTLIYTIFGIICPVLIGSILDFLKKKYK